MAQLNTRIVLRNDSLQAWEASSSILLKGEMGVAYCEDGSVIVKFGDGVKTWKELGTFGGGGSSSVYVVEPEEGQTHVDAIVAKLGEKSPVAGDIAIVKESDGNTAYVYADADWLKISCSASEVVELESRVEQLINEVATIKEVLTPAEGDSLLARVENLEGQMDILNGEGEGSILQIAREEAAAQINDFATKVSDDGVINSFKEMVDYAAEHQGEAAAMVTDIVKLKELVGEKSVLEQIEESGHISEEKATAVFKHVKYEITNKPVGTIVDYRDKEIRVMCPADTQWVKQNVGATGNSNMHYMGFKAYAPSGAVSFKEGDKGVIIDEMFDFTGDFAGTDAYGRNYSICWFPLASYDEASDTWTYFGKNSSVDKYMGWTYVVEWYDSDGFIISSDCIRINLSNELCHNAIEPFYLKDAMIDVSLNGTTLEEVEGVVDIPLGAGLKGSDEISIDEDGTINVNAISVEKIIQDEEEILILNGGCA